MVFAPLKNTASNEEEVALVNAWIKNASVIRPNTLAPIATAYGAVCQIEKAMNEIRNFLDENTESRSLEHFAKEADMLLEASSLLQGLNEELHNR